MKNMTRRSIFLGKCYFGKHKIAWKAFLTIFADVSSITQSSSTIHELNARLNLDAPGVFAWANLNGMALNTSKTKSILITSQKKLHRLNDHSLDVMIDGK